jgi:hypothetical protein
MTLLAATVGVIDSTRAGGILFTDDFTRANENPLAGNWSTAASWDAMQLLNNQVGAAAGPAGNASYVNSVSVPDDQYAESPFVQSLVNIVSAGGGVCVRMATGAKSYYCLQIFNGTSTNPVTLDVFKEVAGSYTSLGQAPYTYTPGDVFRIEAQGTAIRGYVNGVLKLSATDSDLASGPFGLSGFISSAPAGQLYGSFTGGAL